MDDDYRNTEYCEPLGDVRNRKNTVVAMVREDHPRARDMHEYISKNDIESGSVFVSTLHSPLNLGLSALLGFCTGLFPYVLI